MGVFEARTESYRSFADLHSNDGRYVVWFDDRYDDLFTIDGRNFDIHRRFGKQFRRRDAVRQVLLNRIELSVIQSHRHTVLVNADDPISALT